MKTPIKDFIENYSGSDKIRFHMPGHKGFGQMESMDITEISGADSLYEASGIIAESERNAGALFGADTFYSAEGSSLCIRAMLYLVAQYSKTRKDKCKILATRNAHKVFLNTAALLDIEIEWIYPACGETYLSCSVDPARLEKALESSAAKPDAVYITSPDYLGNMADIKELSEVCRRYGVLLLVDNAHGAYLKFLPNKLHPIDQGADMCCDSAHKTLPVITGGAYLHICKQADVFFKENAKNAMAMFGSTSPSYLILTSLDKANKAIADGLPKDLEQRAESVGRIKASLQKAGYDLVGNEPLKITIAPKSYGYTGFELANYLNKNQIICEFCDNDFVVLMVSAANTPAQLSHLESTLLALEKKVGLNDHPPLFKAPVVAISPCKAIFSPCINLAVDDCLGRVLAVANVSCPPAVPIVACGEVIDAHAIQCLKYYGITTCTVIENK